MDCDCGRSGELISEGEWASVHSPNCASEKFAPRHLDLRCGEPHRPRLSVCIDEDVAEAGEKPIISVTVGALWAQPQRFIDLKPDEARQFAQHLNELANALDSLKASDV